MKTNLCSAESLFHRRDAETQRNWDFFSPSRCRVGKVLNSKRLLHHRDAEKEFLSSQTPRLRASAVHLSSLYGCASAVKTISSRQTRIQEMSHDTVPR
jgi:hypothetical protein